MIEKDKEFLIKFQERLITKYSILSSNVNSKVPLSRLIQRTGKTLKNGEWLNKEVLDLSSMQTDNIFIESFSDGKDFKTNIKTVNNYDLVYGSIRPYFRKAGVAIDVEYIAGTVFSFKPKNKNDFIWLLALISSNEFHLFTSRNSQGTKMPIINWNIFVSYEVPYSKEKISLMNHELIFLLELAINKVRNIRKLKQIKNVLLKKYF